MAISGAMKTHLAGSATYLAHLFRVEERARECVVSWAGASMAGVVGRGGYLRKTGAATSDDSGARSIAAFDADVFVRATTRLAGAVDGLSHFGLASSTSSPRGNTIDFAFRIQAGQNLKVYESNVLKFTHSSPAKANDNLRVVRTGTTITYYLNRTKLYTSAASSTGTLYAAAAFTDPKATIEQVVFGYVGQVITVTDHTRPITYLGEVYKPLPLLPTRFVHTDGLAPNNAELTHILSSSGVTEADVIGGRWDYARYEFSAVNYLDLTMGVARRMVGHFGAVRVNTAGYFAVEMRSLSQPMSMEIGDLVGALCVARQLGDFRCGLPMDSYTHDTTISSVTNSLVLVLGLSKADGYFEYGLIRFRTGNNRYFEREIKNNVGTTITLQRPFPFLPVAADAVTVIAGCNRTTTKCKTFVNANNPSGTNIENHQGFPTVPGLSKALKFPD